MSRIGLLLSFTIATFIGVMEPAHSKRVALSVGVNTYSNLPSSSQLSLSVSDSRAMADALMRTGFEVTTLTNPGRGAFFEAADRLLKGVSPEDELVFFFSGHGVQIDGQNYLLLADTLPLSDGTDIRLKSEAIALAGFMAIVEERRPRVAIYILDASRENPYIQRNTRSIRDKGLAPVEAARNVFVMYSAGPNEISLDRAASPVASENSVFVSSLVQNLSEPNLSLPELALRVRRQVSAATQGRQNPTSFDSLITPYCFRGCGATAGPGTLPAGPKSAAAIAEAKESAKLAGSSNICSDPEKIWMTVRDSTSPAILSEFSAICPGTAYARLAGAKLQEIQSEIAAQKLALAGKPQPQPSGAADPIGRRVALVIGNGTYKDQPVLINPPNDAKAVAEKLRTLGFAKDGVVEKHDLDLKGLSDALRDFGDLSAEADWSVIFFAGHGIEVGGSNYLIPTDARLIRDTHVKDEAIPLERVLEKARGARRLRLVILDACRNNPFADRMIRSTGVNRSVIRGLEKIEPEGGVLVIYATKHGHVASDGNGLNSPFTEAFLEHVGEPGIELTQLVGRIRLEVLKKTGNVQEPWMYGAPSSEQNFFRVKN